MKKKLLYFLIAPLIISSPIVLSSCASNFAHINSKQVIEYNLNAFDSKELMFKSINEWQNEISLNEYQQLIDTINNLIDSQIVVDDNASLFMNELNTNSDNELCKNVILQISNNNYIYNIYIKNMFNFSYKYIEQNLKPNSSLVSQPIDLNQSELSSISDVNIDSVNDNELINAINLVAPNNGFYIPKIYYLKSKNLINDKYTFIFSLNPSYKQIFEILGVMNNWNDIVININVSISNDSNQQTSFNLNLNDISTFFQTTDINTIKTMSQIDIFNSLNNYINSLTNINNLPPNCLDKNNNLFNFNIVNLNNELIINFSTNPNDNNNLIYYRFILDFSV